MSIQPWYDVWCDDEDCNQWTHGGATRRDAAEAAREAGWKRTADGRWWCLDHLPSCQVMLTPTVRCNGRERQHGPGLGQIGHAFEGRTP